MGNRSRYVAVTAAAAAGAVVSARRTARLRQAAEGVRDTILPSHVVEVPTGATPAGDESHAPGHQHLGPDARAAQARERSRGRRIAQYAKGMRHRLPDK